MTKSSWLLGVLMPLVIIALILMADALEGEKTAFVGVLAVVPVFAAVFGTPASTALVGVATVASAYAFGLVASDGSAPAQTVRLVIIAIMTVLAVVAARLRQVQDRRLAEAERRADRAASMEALALTDQLTRIPNRRGVLGRVAEMTEPTERTVALMDLDNLKPVNDERGHLIGDAYIQAVARRLAGAVSSADAVGRWGGDEFLLVFDQPVEQGEAIVHRIHGTITDHPVATGGLTLPVSASVGVARWAAGESLDTAITRADAALYRAKDSGRNLVVRGFDDRPHGRSDG